MRIPKSFQLLHIRWRVKWLPDSQMRAEDGGRYWGLCSKDEGLVMLNEKLRGKEALIAQTFKHELMHAVMFTMGWELDEGPHTEQMVELMAGILCQFDKTAKY